MEHVRNPIGVAETLLICVAVGVTYIWFTIRSRGKLTPPWWCLLIYAIGTLVATFGDYHIQQTVPLGVRKPPFAEGCLTTVALGAVIFSFFGWAMRVPLPRDLSRAEITHERVVRLGRGSRLEESIRWADLQEVWVEANNNLGSFTGYTLFRLVGPDGELAVWSESPGASDLVERLTQLPGFDNEAYSKAMRSTEDGRFCVWRRKEA
jgi:hypothetical protein